MRQRLLWPRLTSRSARRRASPFQAQGETSQGKARDLHSIYPPHLRPLSPGGYRASGTNAPSPTERPPFMRFVFLGPEFCLQLPPRSPSQDHACRSARGSQPPGSPRDFHPQVTSRLAFAARLFARLTAGRAMPGARRVARAVARPSPLRSEQGDFHHSAPPLKQSHGARGPFQAISGSNTHI